MQNAIQNLYTQPIREIRAISGCGILFYEFSLSSIVALHLSRALYKFTSFMQNKPNFRKPKMNTKLYLTKTYENKTLGGRGKNKPNQTQFFKQSYQLMLLHSKYLKKTRGEFREKNLNQPQSQNRAFSPNLPNFRSAKFLVCYRLVLSFTIFVPFQTTFITDYITTTYKKTLLKSSFFAQKLTL
jgi:hypothetical protein